MSTPLAELIKNYTNPWFEPRSLASLAREANLSRSHVARVAKGERKPSLDTVLRLTYAMHIDPQDCSEYVVLEVMGILEHYPEVLDAMYTLLFDTSALRRASSSC
jgi:transcriptional regulator with XRE-family HTH domain